MRAEMRAKRQFEWVARRKAQRRDGVGVREEEEDRTALQMERATVAENGRESRNCPRMEGEGERASEGRRKHNRSGIFADDDAVTARQNGERAGRVGIRCHAERTTFRMSEAISG